MKRRVRFVYLYFEKSYLVSHKKHLILQISSMYLNESGMNMFSFCSASCFWAYVINLERRQDYNFLFKTNEKIRGINWNA